MAHEAEQEKEKQKNLEQLAAQVLSLARDSIVVNMRFMDVALAGLSPVPGKQPGCIYCDGSHLYYDPVVIAFFIIVFNMEKQKKNTGTWQQILRRRRPF